MNDIEYTKQEHNKEQRNKFNYLYQRKNNMNFIKVFLILFISLFVSADPVLPPISPTPGLSIQAQKTNYKTIREGKVLKQVMAEGRKYTLRVLDRDGYSIFILYNDKDHVILMTGSPNVFVRYGLGLELTDPFPHPFKQKSRIVIVDHKRYTIKIIIEQEGTAILCYNEHNHYIFALADPIIVD